jgi:2-oxoglutarate dehydrogenase E2 component (dihydrolipoamide succinyltransferase)
VSGEVLVRPMMYISLTYDHRVVDGEQAVKFLRRITDCVDDPARILLGV